jgi:hypothetical protein
MKEFTIGEDTTISFEEWGIIINQKDYNGSMKRITFTNFSSIELSKIINDKKEVKEIKRLNKLLTKLKKSRKV